MDQGTPRGRLHRDPDANAAGFACPLCGYWLTAEELDGEIGYDDVFSGCGHLWGRAVEHYTGEDGIPPHNPIAELQDVLEHPADDSTAEENRQALLDLFERFEAALFGHFAIVERAVGGLGTSTVQYYPFAENPRQALERTEQAEAEAWERLARMLRHRANPAAEETEDWYAFEEVRDEARQRVRGGN